MQVRISKQGRRIVVVSQSRLSDLKTAVPGAYETAAGYWTVPLSLESCKLLRQKYGTGLIVSDELRRWAKGVVSSRKKMGLLAASRNARLEILSTRAPKLYGAMRARKYQKVGARFIADNAATLIADDPGLGKTLIAMGGIIEADVPGPYLIVAPKTAADSVWRREIQRWLPREHRPITLPEIRYQREHVIRLTRYGDKTWLIVHPEIVMVDEYFVCQECKKRSPIAQKTKRTLACGHLRDTKTPKITAPAYPKLFEIEWGAVISDESHETLIVRTGVPTQRRRGMEMLRLRGDGIRIALSGTPFDSKPHQLWGTLNWLFPTQYSAFHRWTELYWKKGGYTGYQIGEFMKERESMLWDSLTTVALRRTKAEVATDLPPKTYVGSSLDPSEPDSPIGVWLPLDGRQQKAYREMETLSVTELESGRLEAITALAELTRLKQLASCYGDIEQYKAWDKDEDGNRIRVTKFRYVPRLPSNKFDWLIENLEEWGFPKTPVTKVVIVSFYTGILNLFAEGINSHFSTRNKQAELCTAITGRTPSQHRRTIIDRFNERGGPAVMMLNVKAGGTAITLDSADHMVFLSETRIPDQQNQAEDRIHRVSNPRNCFYWYLRSLDTVDVGTAIVNKQMDEETRRLLDGRRGVEYTRNVIDLSHTPLARAKRAR